MQSRGAEMNHTVTIVSNHDIRQTKYRSTFRVSSLYIQYVEDEVSWLMFLS